MNEQNPIFNLLAMFFNFLGTPIIPVRTGPGAMEGGGRIVGCVKYKAKVRPYPVSDSPVEEYERHESEYQKNTEYYEFK